MPVVPIRDLVGGGGVNADVSPNELPPNAWNNGINCRFSRSRIERIGGNELYQDFNSDVEVADAQVIWGIIRNGAEGQLMITDAEIYIDIGGGWQDVSPVAPIVDSSKWIVSQYGDWIICTTVESTQEPLVLAPAGGQFIPFTAWTAGYQAIKIFPYKNFLVAVGIEITNDEQNGLVIWSDVVNESILQDVDWNPANPASLAGENILPSADGLIRDGGVLRDTGILYTDTSVWRMDISNAQAGVSPLVFNFRKVFDDDGILASRCFEEVNGRHYVVGVYDIYVHDGFNKQSISDNRMTEFFYGRLGTGNFAFMTHYQRPQEIIISYSSAQSSLATEALIYNYFYDTWTRFQGGFNYSHLILAPEFAIAAPTWADLQASGTRWSDLNATTWNDLFPQNRNRIPYMLVPSAGAGAIYLVDRNTTAASGIDLFLERRDLDLDEFFNGTRNVKHIKRMLPHMTGDGECTIQWGGRMALGEPIQWQTEQPYNLLADYKFDLRLSWRFPAVRIRQTTLGNALVFTGYDLEVAQASYR